MKLSELFKLVRETKMTDYEIDLLVHGLLELSAEYERNELMRKATQETLNKVFTL